MINPRKVRHLWTGGVISVLVMAGILCTWRLVHRADLAMRNDLLHKAEVVARSLNPERITSLSGTPSDMARPEYSSLKRQLASIAAGDGSSHSIFLMGCNPDGHVVFYVDNEVVGSESEPPTGEIYEDIPPAYLTGFDTKKVLTVGSVTDRESRNRAGSHKASSNRRAPGDAGYGRGFGKLENRTRQGGFSIDRHDHGAHLDFSGRYEFILPASSRRRWRIWERAISGIDSGWGRGAGADFFLSHGRPITRRPVPIWRRSGFWQTRK